MNNNQNGSGSNGFENTDDILKILKKKKEEENKDQGTSPEPTRVDHNIVKKASAEKTVDGTEKAKNNSSSSSNKPTKASSEKASPKGAGSSSGTAVSLSDFDDTSARRRNAGKKKKKYVPGYVKLIIYLVSVIAVSVILSVFAIKIGNDVFAFVKPDKEITVTISKDATLSDVADELHEKGIIEYPTVYKLYSKFRISKRSYLSGKFLEGEHVLTPAMNYDQLLAALSLNKNSKEVVRVTIQEGLSYYEIINLFIEKGVMTENDREAYIEAVNNFEYDYKFMEEYNKADISEDRLYRLEGYLFPDTYDFYVGENPVSALDKLLSNFSRKFDESWYARAGELGYTVDEIVTLASMIEAEGNNPEDYAKISSVFHNRLKNNGSFPYLDSDATVLYSYQGEKKQLEGGDTKSRIHPYNTYLNRGLPPGPICSPGYEAIYAALYPESTNYYYFLTMSNGETVYSRTLDEHNAAIVRSNKLQNN